MLESPLLENDIPGILILHEILKKHNDDGSCVHYSLYIIFAESNEERLVKDHEIAIIILNNLAKKGRKP